MKKKIFIYFGIFSQLTSCIAMNWTYLQTIPSMYFASSYFGENLKYFKEILTCFIYILHIHFLVHPNFDLVSSLLVLFAARKVVQMTTEMIECYHLRYHFTVLQNNVYHVGRTDMIDILLQKR